MKNVRKLCVLFVSLVFSTQSVSAQQADAQKWSGQGLRLEIAALSGDTVKAFFIGRDFSSKDAGFIAATGCVFRSAIGNAGISDSDADVNIDLTKWRVIVKGVEQPLKTRQDWATVWTKRAVAETPTIAFHWALFPTRQHYKPTDYNWGMLTFALPPQTQFDLQMVWQQGDKMQRHLLKNLECGK